MKTEQWYLRTQDDTFGPETKERLIEWARMGRIQPGQEVSQDGRNWTPAVEVPFLDMRWSIDIGDGTPRGPFNRHAAQALLSSGRLPKTSRLVETVPPFAGTPSAAPPPSAPEPPQPDVDARTDAAAASTAAELEKAREELAAARREAAAARREAAAARRETDAARAENANTLKALESLKDSQQETTAALAEKDSALAEKDGELEKARRDATDALAAKDDEIAKVREEVSAARASEAEYEARVLSLSDEIKRFPANAKLAADAQTALYALMQEEAEDLSAAIDAETRELEELRVWRRKRSERMIARRQEILKRIGTDAEDMTRRALRAHPDDPRTVHLRQELDALRVLQERAALESESKIKDLAEKLRERDTELVRLRRQAADTTVIYRQLQETREKLQRREKELVEERQKAEEERLHSAAAQQALLARLSALEMGLPGATHQSREARSVRLAPWMGLKG